MSNSSNIQCNGPKLRQLRTAQSMTQEKLAAMSKVDHRTVQRAEQSKSIQLETLASLADALKVTIGDLTLSDSNSNVDRGVVSETEECNAVVLRRVTSGKVLIDMLCDSFSGKLYCATEPTEQNIDALTAVVDRIERKIPNPWQNPWGLSP